MPTAPQTTSAPPQAIILAAGKGTRMAAGNASPLPKVVYPVADRPMIYWVVQACLAAGVTRCLVVIGYRGELVREALAGIDPCEFVEQKEQLGTGHAARMAQPLFDGRPPTDTFVLAGDGPLIRPATLSRLLQVHRERRAAATLATSVIPNPQGYGRVIRSADGGLDRIVEEKDATEEQKRIREVNPSYYCFRSDRLFHALTHVRNDNRQKEYYITDVPAVLQKAGEVVAVVDAVPPEDVLSINTPQELAIVDGIMRRRLAREPGPA